MSRDGWIEATLEFINVRDDALAAFIAECVEQGAVGSAEKETFSAVKGDTGSADCEECGTFSRYLVYFPDHMGVENILDLLEEKTRTARPGSHVPSARLLRVRRIEKEDWATNWMHSFPAEQVSQRFWVVPPWNHETLPADAVSIVLEPGLAFGTGKHVTTRHCLGFMEEITLEPGTLPPTFLDAGCGSAILSLAAAKLGAKKILGIDNDPDAIHVAYRNLALNDLQGRIRLVNGPLESCRGPYRLIAANLTGEILNGYAERIRELLERNGRCILSGMLDTETEALLQRYEELGFQVISEKVDREEGWTTLLLEISAGS